MKSQVIKLFLNILVSLVAAGCSSKGFNWIKSAPKRTVATAAAGSLQLTTDQGDTQYIIFKLTHPGSPTAANAFAEINRYADEMFKMYGPNDRHRKRAWGFGVWGINPLRQSPAEMAAVVNAGFDLAERLQVPVHFDIFFGIEDFVTNFGASNPVDWESDTDMCEWSKLNTPRCTPAWFDWGTMVKVRAIPALGSPKLRAFLQAQLSQGVFPALNSRYQRLKDMNDEYLFAGLALGGETGFADQSNNPLIDQSDWGIMGYNTLRYIANLYPSMLGGRSAGDLVAHPDNLKAFLNTAAVNDFLRFIGKYVSDSTGLPRYKLFTHIVAAEQQGLDASTLPTVKAATSPYSLAGFTYSACGGKTSSTMTNYIMGQILDNERTYGSLSYSLATAPYIWAVEETYGACFGTGAAFQDYLNYTLGNGAKLVAILGWNDPESSTFYLPKNPDFYVHAGIRSWLAASPVDSSYKSCYLTDPAQIAITAFDQFNGMKLTSNNGLGFWTDQVKANNYCVDELVGVLKDQFLATNTAVIAKTGHLWYSGTVLTDINGLDFWTKAVETNRYSAAELVNALKQHFLNDKNEAQLIAKAAYLAFNGTVLTSANGLDYWTNYVITQQLSVRDLRNALKTQYLSQSDTATIIVTEAFADFDGTVMTDASSINYWKGIVTSQQLDLLDLRNVFKQQNLPQAAAQIAKGAFFDFNGSVISAGNGLDFWTAVVTKNQFDAYDLRQELKKAYLITSADATTIAKAAFLRNGNTVLTGSNGLDYWTSLVLTNNWDALEMVDYLKAHF